MWRIRADDVIEAFELPKGTTDPVLLACARSRTLSLGPPGFRGNLSLPWNGLALRPVFPMAMELWGTLQMQPPSLLPDAPWFFSMPTLFGEGQEPTHFLAGRCKNAFCKWKGCQPHTEPN